MNPIHDPQWSRLTPEQQKLLVAIATKYRALGGHAFHLTPTHFPGIPIHLPNGKLEFLNPKSLGLDLERLGKEGLIDYSNETGPYLVKPTQAGIAMAEAARDGQFGLTGSSIVAESQPFRDQRSGGNSSSRRNARYAKIDEALREIAPAHPKSHDEVFRFLEDLRTPIPERRLFKNAGGWLKGFQRAPSGARAWLSARWAKLRLPPFPRGPK